MTSPQAPGRLRRQGLSIPGAFSIEHLQHRDDRGTFATLFQNEDVVELMGGVPRQSQFGLSRSRRGVLRGIHVTRTPPGQSKLATCLNGKVIQAVVDLRFGSPTFGHSELLPMSGDRIESVLCPPGVGHAILALSDDVLIGYLVSQHYEPGRELAVNPFDSALAIAWPDGVHTLSSKDREAPGIAELFRNGLLARYQPSQGRNACLR